METENNNGLAIKGTQKALKIFWFHIFLGEKKKINLQYFN